MSHSATVRSAVVAEMPSAQNLSSVFRISLCEQRQQGMISLAKLTSIIR